jgi:beta-galactosidase
MGPDTRFKLHLLPYSDQFHDYGWFDQHHAGGPGVYHDNLYRNPKDFAKYFDHKDEIIYYGEEGAIGTPPRLQLIREDILKRGNKIGWESYSYLQWYEAYDDFLRKNGFTKAFKDVDALTIAMGNVAYYYQGRVIENVRISNTIDGYAVNGWESMMLENHSGIVDNYRNPKGDVDLIARYNKPVYVAVKINKKVVAVGDTSLVDFHIVNEVNLNGDYSLHIKITNQQKLLSEQTIPVKISGGIVYGELLTAGIPVVAREAGYISVTADIRKNNQSIASGDDKIYAVKPDVSGISNGMIADTSGVLSNFLTGAGVTSFKEFKTGRPEGKYLLVGAFQPQQTGNPLVTDILEWVNEGNTLIIISNTEAWTAHLAQKEVIDYRGSKVLGTSWYGGNFFSKQHELFRGLPQAQVFNWEYQCFAAYNRSRVGMRLFNGETIVACVSDHKKEVYSALSIIPHGRGRIILSSLDIFSCIKDIKSEKRAEGDGENAAMNTFNSSRSNKANIVGQQLMLNMLRFACKSHK